MSTGSISTATQITHDRTFHISVIDISLARSSVKVIKSITLYKNDELLKEVEKTIRAGDSHREEFRPPLTIVSGDNICASVTCSSNWRKSIDVNIDISLREIQSMRNEGSMRFSYRKKIRNIEVVISANQQSLSAVTTQILEVCPRFRLLIIGNVGVGKSSLIQKIFGARILKRDTDGEADIEQEYTSPMNGRLVVHESLGFEAGGEGRIDIVKKFVAGRKAMPEIKDQLHAVWLCLEMPYVGSRVVEAGTGMFLQRRSEILGDIPLVVVFTKVDLLDMQLEFGLLENETLDNVKSRHVKKHVSDPLHNVAGNDVTYVTVSMQDDHATSFLTLLDVIKNNMENYHVNEGPYITACIAQRISIKEKIELSIAIGKRRYWKMLLRSPAFLGQALKECLQVIRKDVIAIWNFNDPDECLMDDKIVGALLRNDLGDTADANTPLTNKMHTRDSFSALLESSFEMVKNDSGSRDVTLGILGGVARMSISIPEKPYQDDSHAKDAKVLMAYIVDLICVMQIIFLSISGDRVTPDVVAFALQTYEKSRRIVRRCVAEFNVKSGGVLPGGRDYMLEKIEELIWKYSIPDCDIERLRRRMRQDVLQCVPSLRY